LVSDLLNGRKKGRRGKAHRAAVLLGIKEGTISTGS
jgi:gp16 family phage-associated protein